MNKVTLCEFKKTHCEDFSFVVVDQEPRIFTEVFQQST